MRKKPLSDVVLPAVRSRMMAGIKAKNTEPEMRVRRALHRRGFRYSLHANKLAGKPDLVLPRYGAAIFVNGCFWHGHDCHLFKVPQSRTEFWIKKIETNRRRDKQSRAALLASGWRVLDVWECAMKGRTSLPDQTWTDEIVEWLFGNSASHIIRGSIDGSG